jgi:hypothetical protein
MFMKTLQQLINEATIKRTSKTRRSEQMVSLRCSYCCFWFDELEELGSKSASESILRWKYGEHVKVKHSDLIIDQ